MLLEIDNVSARYEESLGDVLFDVSLEVNPEEIVTLLGPNGAGKSTLLRTIAGVLHPTSGTISYRDSDITGESPREILHRGISLVPEERELFPHMTVQENLEIAAQTSDETDISDFYEMFPILSERSNQMAESLSGGEQQMLAISQALLTDPDLLLLDEPSLGLAPQIVDNVMAVVTRLVDEGVTILLVEQQARRALGVADRAYVLRGGRIRYSGPADDLLEGDQLSEAYLS